MKIEDAIEYAGDIDETESLFGPFQLDAIKTLAAEVKRLRTPRPISEAKTDGTWYLVEAVDGQWAKAQWSDGGWWSAVRRRRLPDGMAHRFIPLPTTDAEPPKDGDT